LCPNLFKVGQLARFSCNILASRSCELSSVNEMTLDLNTRDPEFVENLRSFLLNLKQVSQIETFDWAWVPEGYELIGFVTSQDGGKPGFGTLINSLASENY
jgi:hypothetical protein